MVSWFSSLQFRLVIAFAMALALALAGVSVVVGRAAGRETALLQHEQEQARAGRTEVFLVRRYVEGRGWIDLQPAVEEASTAIGRRVAVRDIEGRTIADSHPRFGPMPRSSGPRPILLDGGREVGVLYIGPNVGPPSTQEPPVTRLVGAVNRSLLWAGLAAGLGGILAVSLVAGRVLTPLRTLGTAARRVGEGDLSQRVAVQGKDEIAELGRTFNAMTEQLETAEARRRAMIADIAHELRTPLSNIQGYLEAIQDGVLQPDAQTLDVIRGQAGQLTRLVEDLRLLAQADAGALTLHRNLDSLDEVLRRSVDAFLPRARAKGVALSLDLRDGLPLVEMDRARIAQVVGNLLDNAISYTPEGGRVRASAEVASGFVRVTVDDNGEGIPAEHLPHVFDRFYRVDPSRTRATGGAGLGLTIVERLVELHGGTVHADSILGRGSRFTFELPLARQG